MIDNEEKRAASAEPPPVFVHTLHSEDGGPWGARFDLLPSATGPPAHPLQSRLIKLN